MKVKKIWNSCIRWVFVFLLIVTVLPVSSVHAGVTYTKVTQEAQLKTGKYIMVVDSGYAPTYLESGWIGAEQPIIHSEEIVDPNATMVWQLEVDPIQKLVSLKDSKGNVIKPLGGNNNGISTGEYLWKYAYGRNVYNCWAK